MDAKTFLIPKFTYNGQVTLKTELFEDMNVYFEQFEDFEDFEDMNVCFEQAPDAHFWVGEGSRPGPEVTIFPFIPSIP